MSDSLYNSSSELMNKLFVDYLHFKRKHVIKPYCRGSFYMVVFINLNDAIPTSIASLQLRS
ncbi:hypothetical protein GCM10010954_24820 [Halobacillus andaensis]|uniref:Uncharacterized protein n=1 Tax=Halobacillus andaensis TaxID=1176239 RepID=A0A917EWE9_HALAA|nr:hypothetical protein GCM10010954_24820 [Halobacillus andaensis]